MRVWATFEGGPLDGADEAIGQVPDPMVFSSAHVVGACGEWQDGPLRVCDTVYDLASLTVHGIHALACYRHRP